MCCKNEEKCCISLMVCKWKIGIIKLNKAKPVRPGERRKGVNTLCHVRRCDLSWTETRPAWGHVWKKHLSSTDTHIQRITWNWFQTFWCSCLDAQFQYTHTATFVFQYKNHLCPSMKAYLSWNRCRSTLTPGIPLEESSSYVSESL